MSSYVSNLFGSRLPGTANKQPILLELRSSKLLLVFTVTFAVFTDLFLYAVIVPVIPFALRSRAGIPDDETQYWVSVLLAVYGAALLVSAPICGWISDKISSRRLPFLSGLILLAGATLFLTLGRTISMFIVGRILQGFSAAIVWVCGLALLVDSCNSKVGEAMGTVTLGMTFAILLAPMLGGIVFDKAGYYAVYAMCFGLLGFDILLRLVVIEKKIKHQWLGASRSASAAASRVATPHPEPSDLSETKGSTDSSDPSRIAPSTIPAAPTAADSAFVAAVNRRLGFRLPPMITLLASRRLLSALWGTLVQATVLTSLDSTLPLHVRNTFHWTSLGAGLIFLAVVLPTAASPWIGKYSDRYGPRYFAASGYLLACPFFVLLRLIDRDTTGQKVILGALLTFLGTSLALAFPPIMAEITYVVESKERPTANRPGIYLGKYGAYGQAYALFNVAFAAGCLVGPIWGGMIRQHYGWGTMTWTIGLFSALTSIPIFLWTGGWFFDSTKRHWIPQQQRPPTRNQDPEQNAPEATAKTDAHAAGIDLESNAVTSESK